MADTEFARVIVIGSAGTGKSSLIATAVASNAQGATRPTKQIERYNDCERRIQFIDTAGIREESLFSDDKSAADLKSDPVGVLNQRFDAFCADPFVRELLARVPEGKETKQIDRKTAESCDAYLIVYSNADAGLHIAKALRLALISAGRDAGRCIFTVRNDGVPPPPGSAAAARGAGAHGAAAAAAGSSPLNMFNVRGQLPPTIQGADRDVARIFSPEPLLGSRHFASACTHLAPVNAATGERVEEMLDEIAAALGTQAAERAESRKRAALAAAEAKGQAADDRMCSVPDACVIA